MNGITFVKEKSGLARKLAGDSHISGIVIFHADLTSELPKIKATSVDDLPDNVDSIVFYHVSEFFRINPGATLYVSAHKASDGAYNEIKVMQTFASGSIRQFAVLDKTRAFSALSAGVTALNNIAKEMWNLNYPTSILFSIDIASSEFPNLPNLHTLNAEHVSVVIGHDLGGYGNYLAGQSFDSVSCLGTCLGALSKAKIHESIAWVERQDLVSDIPYDKSLTGGIQKANEMDVIGFVDGSPNGDYTAGQLQSINDKGYIFCVKYSGITGSFFNDSYTATSLDNDYAYIENNRVISEAIRAIDRVLTPKISGPASIDPDTGELEASTVSALEGICEEALEEMRRDGNISGYGVIINPSQPVLSTSKLEIVLKVVPIGILREIVVKIGLTLRVE